MSQDINNRERRPEETQSFRKEKLKEIIRQLHDGHTREDVQAEFSQHFGDVSAEEISAAEDALIKEGMPVEEVQRLCDVHAAVFKGAICGSPEDAGHESQPGHPAHTLRAENKALEGLLRSLREQLEKGPVTVALKQEAARLIGIDSHYKIKENLLFPYLEKYGVQGPPKVMWGVDDEIRREIKLGLVGLEQGDGQALLYALQRLEDMAFKEENILLPLLMEKLTLDEWRQVADDTPEFGYFLIDPPTAWRGNQGGDSPAEGQVDSVQADRVILPTGSFRLEELAAIFGTLPMDITFVDRDDKVRFFSQTKDRAFPRTLSVLGRDVSNCHPPASVHIVEKIVSDFKSGRKDHEDFWIQMGGRLIHIRYFALRGDQGEYLGVVETTQDIAPLKAISGEKRLLSGE
ncbi:MAG: DUF438 domain-containing protein [Eubacteriales bacterium]|jgi:DUF438 domain-containing protein|nr:DUF438 domain-containing protein [Eubacteriales bacterium]MDD3572506.1 DUF438 domain-containing protein [Eubacteriales bacterium]MDD4134618.1 DUF438 domain-containing protein [Eubacteriales bacterium]NLO13456.1 DUF438 domain-containing protein [Clostridiales bacterium]